MLGAVDAFFGLVGTPLVQRGSDFKIPATEGGHTFGAVYGEMLLQICRDYPGLPDPRTLRASEIRFFYNGLRAELRAATK